jgi:hypothetical protein
MESRVRMYLPNPRPPNIGRGGICSRPHLDALPLEAHRILHGMSRYLRGSLLVPNELHVLTQAVVKPFASSKERSLPLQIRHS